MDYSEYNNSELNNFRNIQNSKIHIYQINNEKEPIYRNIKNQKKLKPYNKSFEYENIKKDSIKILESSSNMLIYSMANNQSLHNSNIQIKKILSNSIESIDKRDRLIKEKYNNFVRKIHIKNLKSDPEFIKLSEFLDNPKLDEQMRGNYYILETVLRHRYLRYHEKGKEIYDYYKGFLNKDYFQSNESNDDYDYYYDNDNDNENYNDNEGENNDLEN